MTFNNIFPSQAGQILLFSFLQFNNKKDIYYVKKNISCSPGLLSIAIFSACEWMHYRCSCSGMNGV